MKKETKITSFFWKKYRDIVRNVMIPYQWDVLNDKAGISIERERSDAYSPSEKSHALENFRIAAGRTKGEHYGWVFQDSDVYKWLEAVAYSLQEKDDPQLHKTADEVVDLIADAQEPDGYLDTYFTIKAPNRKFCRLGESHELYCAGHFMEAAAAYYQATKNKQVLMVAEKLADCIDQNFGPEEGKLHGYDGHEEVEIGLMKMYHLLHDEKYLKLARYFLLERGKKPNFLRREYEEDKHNPSIIEGMEKWPDTYFQNHKPVLEQETAEGHAVRLIYLCTAMADVAATTHDQKLAKACKKLWDNITGKRMYVTGGIGQTAIGESFTMDYDLPNDTMYCETCASVGFVFFARQMLRLESNGKYADIMERVLYNSAISGMALDGKHFFYVNPLEVDPKKSKGNPLKTHVKPVRPSWLGCACCPPNLARLLASLDQYIYTVKKEAVLINLLMASETTIEVPTGTMSISQKTDYPFDGRIKIILENNSDDGQKIGIHIPGWCREWKIMKDGTAMNTHCGLESGYYYVGCDARSISEIELDLTMTPERVYSNAHVSEDAGKAALSLGPFIYCLEERDNGAELHNLRLPETAKINPEFHDELLGGIIELKAEGIREENTDEEDLYSFHKKKITRQMLTFIPYYAWANRGENEMQVWVRE